MFEQTPKKLDCVSGAVFSSRLRSPEKLNDTLLAGFLKWHDDNSVRKTHLFAGRYENIYLNETHIPQLTTVIDAAIKSAEIILQTKNLRAGYWFNYMPAGASTTLHTHDDDDELLSGVYYIHAAKNSGDLIIHEKNPEGSPRHLKISPEAGKFIFFKPNVAHEVAKNLSSEHRLSIGINFGIPAPD